MRKLIKVTLGIIFMSAVPVTAMVEQVADGVGMDSLVVSAPEALMRLDVPSLDILTEGNRIDMLEYMRIDSVYNVHNAMEGFSHIERPFSQEYLKVSITPVSSLTIKVLPGNKKNVIATSYTIGDSLLAADSDIRFYDEEMKEIEKKKIIKIASSKDFFDFSGLKGDKKKELMELVPFPTVEYTLSPDNTTLTATLTVGSYMGKENLEKITPYLRRTRLYHWNGSRYEMEK